MLLHIVIFEWKAGTSAEQIEAVGRGIDRLGSEIADVTSLRHGPDLRIREGNGDYALCAGFADEAAWRRYQAHPAHQTFVRDVVAPLRVGGLSIQISADGTA